MFIRREIAVLLMTKGNRTIFLILSLIISGCGANDEGKTSFAISKYGQNKLSVTLARTSVNSPRYCVLRNGKVVTYDGGITARQLLDAMRTMGEFESLLNGIMVVGSLVIATAVLHPSLNYRHWEIIKTIDKAGIKYKASINRLWYLSSKEVAAVAIASSVFVLATLYRGIRGAQGGEGLWIFTPLDERYKMLLSDKQYLVFSNERMKQVTNRIQDMRSDKPGSCDHL